MKALVISQAPKTSLVWQSPRRHDRSHLCPEQPRQERAAFSLAYSVYTCLTALWESKNFYSVFPVPPPHKYLHSTYHSVLHYSHLCHFLLSDEFLKGKLFLKLILSSAQQGNQMRRASTEEPVGIRCTGSLHFWAVAAHGIDFNLWDPFAFCILYSDLQQYMCGNIWKSLMAQR